MTRRRNRRARSWTLDWLELMATASHDQQVYLCAPMNQPLVSSRTVNNEKYLRDTHKLLTTTLPPKLTYGRKLARAVYELEGVALESYNLGNVVIHPQVQDGVLNLFVTIPEAYMDFLPSYIMQVCFLGLDAIAWVGLRGKKIKAGMVRIHVLQCKYDKYIKDLADEYREGYTHEYKPIPEALYDCPHKLQETLERTFTFPCQRWWEK